MADPTKVVVRADRIAASYNGNLESVRHATDELMQGSIVTLGALVTDEREVKLAVQPATATLGTLEHLMVLAPEVLYEVGKSLQDFTTEALTAVRAYHLSVGDIVTISKTYGASTATITGSPALNGYAHPQNGSYLLAAAAAITDVSGSRLAFRIIEEDVLGPNGVYEAWVLQVVKS